VWWLTITDQVAYVQHANTHLKQHMVSRYRPVGLAILFHACSVCTVCCGGRRRRLLWQRRGCLRNIQLN